MGAAPLPPDEEQRLARLEQTRVLDTAPQQAFDDLVKLASRVCDTPVALVSLVDRDRQWFKARVGLKTSETARDHAFCAHAILDQRIMQVPDALADDRFRDNPLVTGDPNIRFYAGAPMFTEDGYALGSFCVIDQKPRTLTLEQTEILAMLSRQATLLIQLHQREAEHLEQAQKLKALAELLDITHDSIIARSLDGRILFWNRGAERTYGWSAKEAAGRVKFELLKTKFPKPLPQIEEELHAKGYWEGQLVHTAKDGREIIAASRWALEQDATGTPIGVLETNNDVTRASEVDRMKSEFVATVSHELRTPLTSIHGSLRFLASGMVGALAPEAKELVDIAQNNTERLIRLINDILDLEKIESGRLELTPRTVDAVALAKTAIAGIEGFAGAHGVELRLEAPPDRWINGDEDRIVQVLTNLISNAIKFSPQGAKVEVAVSDRENTQVRFSVRDRGPGIPREKRSGLFEKFRQLDASPSRRKGGTGLGLAISKAIVEQHGGEIGVDFDVEVGTRFWFTLARAEDPAIEAELSALRKDYGAQLPAKLEALRAAIAAGEMEKASTLAHRLRGSAGSYRYEEIGAAAAVLEDRIQALDAEQDAEARGKVTAALDALAELVVAAQPASV